MTVLAEEDVGLRPSEILQTHRQTILAAVSAHGLTNPRVIGSVARQTDTTDSDLDLLVSVPAGAALGFLCLSEYLSTELGIHVDVISEGGLCGSYRSLLDEAVPL